MDVMLNVYFALSNNKKDERRGLYNNLKGD